MDFNDYHAFTSTSGGSGGSGCFSGTFITWLIAGIVILWCIGKMAG